MLFLYVLCYLFVHGYKFFGNGSPVSYPSNTPFTSDIQSQGKENVILFYVPLVAGTWFQVSDFRFQVSDFRCLFCGLSSEEMWLNCWNSSIHCIKILFVKITQDLPFEYWCHGAGCVFIAVMFLKIVLAWQNPLW